MLRVVVLLLLLAPTLVRGAAPVPVSLQIEPATVHLREARATFTLLITELLGSGEARDRTSEATYRSENPQIARVDASGRIDAIADGSTQIIVTLGTEVRRVPIVVEGTTRPIDWNFENHIVPILSRHGCNSSGCHGKAEGQNGFKLSVFGFDPAADHAALTREGRGRRLFLAAPEHSLLLRKAVGQVPHGGGARMKPEMADYATLREWVAAGAPLGDRKKAPLLLGVRVEPTVRTLPPKARQQVRVWARWNDGREVDVTPHARFQSNNEAIVTVDPQGLAQALDLPGEATVLAAYRDQTAVVRLMVPRAATIAKYPDLPVHNAIDRHVWARLRLLNVLPSDLCDDATFLRRVTLDLLGVLPTPDELRTFLADGRPDRRARIVEVLLERPEFADYWAMKWADLLRVDRQTLGAKQTRAFHAWIRQRVADNQPLDRFARDILQAEGPLSEVPQAALFKAIRKPGELASHVSQVFLGVRIHCAECHHHPYDRWGQGDYLGMQGFFSGVRLESSPGFDAVIGGPSGAGKHPRTGAEILAHALGQPEPMATEPGDARRRLADWMTARDNPFFARNLANRVWAHLLGRGLVEPVDDVRATNPPTNPELLDHLATVLVEGGFDVKKLIREIVASRVYQLASQPNETNDRDEQNYSRALLRRVPAEVLLDMVSQATGVAERFDGMPAGSRAVQLWDSKLPHYFLKTFGRPGRSSACECERVSEPGVAQVLHLLNAPEIQAKLAHPGGTVARLVREHAQDDPLVTKLYRVFYSRLPTEAERRVAGAFLTARKANRQAAVEDLAWTLLNSLEFGFNH